MQLDGGVVADCGIGLDRRRRRPLHVRTRPRTYLRGKPPTAEHLAAAGQICHDAVDPQADQRGPVDYKRHLARELVARALTRSAARARRSERLMQVTMNVNGEEVTRDVEPRLLLVHFVRDHLAPHRHALGMRHLQLRGVRACGSTARP